LQARFPKPAKKPFYFSHRREGTSFDWALIFAATSQHTSLRCHTKKSKINMESFGASPLFRDEVSRYLTCLLGIAQIAIGQNEFHFGGVFYTTDPKKKKKTALFRYFTSHGAKMDSKTLFEDVY
jgi:hypothetical protein